MTAYSAPADLLIGDITIGPGVDLDKYVNEAADEINARLSMVYEFPMPDLADLTMAGQLTLKKANNFIATGRLLMALAVAGEDSSVQAYGQSLLLEGFNELKLMLDGTIDLGAPRIAGHDTGVGPTIAASDATSAVDAFESHYFVKHPHIWPWPVYPVIPWTPGS